ncbi:C40 family peptidase [Kitasatospora herbaricolor]|uniref:C40 family peptidase n=1 Tax=Kitasatospora herbaricolor TaxID=68217 RepID=A0ABZ1WB56_9ACTN|nr:C40 family peptidase [Kitasatospora herbaricolor]
MTRRLLPILLLALTSTLSALPAAGAAPAPAAVPHAPGPAGLAAPAEPGPPPGGPQPGEGYPSAEEIARSRADTDLRAAASAAVEARLTAAQDEREQASLAAERAVENYNGAQARLTRARLAESRALGLAAAAELARYAAAEEAARLAAETYRQGATAELSAIDALIGAPGPRAAGAQAAVVRVVSGSTRQILDAATGTAAAATRAGDAAREATAAAERAAGEVRTARDRAQAQVATGRAKVAEIGRRREQLLGELAAARNTTVELERRRREAQEAIAARAAEEAARTAAEAAAATQAAADRIAAERAATEKAATEKAAAERAAASAQEQAAGPPVAPSDGPGVWSAQGAEAAIAFARSKIGLPYIWGGEGPDGYDCSGLTMMAWRTGGRRITHFAADQYAESTPVTYRQLRPGDLVFWSDTGRAADIHHVGLYIGDDQMIEAPRAGMPIKQASLWIMGTPDFYARP